MDNAIMAANEKQSSVTEDEEVLRVYEMQELAQMDIDNGLKYARSEGIKEGMRKGIRDGKKEEKIETARNALAKGISPELIHDITGLDIEIIKSLRQNI